MELVRDIGEELKSSYLDYAMSVIVGRALPDVRDGLKPVQRRILYSMFEMGLRHDRPYVKCARVVGHVLGHYHPHGDQPVYEALVRMAQDFVMRYPLIDGHGNFGSIDGDEPAAMRYTECRLTELAEEMLADIDKDTVDFQPNFDATLKEPIVLPARIPNLLINGCSGIAVGMATNIPPHNLREVCEAIIAYIRNPDITVEELMEFIKGPDFPTGGIIVGRKGIEEAYKTGKGKITVRGKVEVENGAIVIKEIPYMVNKAKLVEKIADLIRNGKIEAKTVRDESDREGIRVVVELKSGTDVKTVLKKLYAHTPLQTTFGIINLALVNGEPRLLSLKDLIACYVEHRREVVRRRTEFELKRAEERLHIVEGLKIALENLDEVVKLIRESESPVVAKSKLMEKYGLSERQAEAILQMRLQKLTSTEISTLISEHEELKRRISRLSTILSSREEIDKIIVDELKEIAEKYGDDRRTVIADKDDHFEERIERNLVVITKRGMLKRCDLNFRTKLSVAVKEDEPACAVICRTNQKLLIFSDSGRAYWISVNDIPKQDRTGKGVNIRKYLGMKEDERVVSAIVVDEFDERFVVILTEDGYIKRIRLYEFANAKRAGVIASTSKIAFARLFESGEVVIGTDYGYIVRFRTDEIPEKGRNARGVRAINLRADDSISWMSIGRGRELLILSKDGFGKRTELEEFRLTSRGSMGVRGVRGSVAVVEFVKGDEEVLVFTKDGHAIKLSVKEIPKMGRNSKGVEICKGGVSCAVLV